MYLPLFHHLLVHQAFSLPFLQASFHLCAFSNLLNKKNINLPAKISFVTTFVWICLSVEVFLPLIPTELLHLNQATCIYGIKL